MSQEKQEAVPQVDYQARCADLESQLEALKKHKEDLLTEAKQAKRDREEQKQAAMRAEQEKSEKAGEYEKLWKTADQIAKEKETQYNSLLNEIKQEKLNSHAMKLAIDLAGGNATSANLLSRFIQERLSKLSDERGNLDNTLIDSIKREFENNKDFAPLLGGSLATGGGARGAQSGGANKGLTMTREEFDQLHPAAQREFIHVKKGQIL